MRILFAGTPETAVTVLEGLMKSGHEVVGVLTREDAKVGRKQALQESPVARFASDKGIPLIKANKVDLATERRISELRADLAIVVAYGTLLKQSTLDLLALGWFNLHYSLLPLHRGAAPVQHAILSGESVTGVTVFKIDQGMDTGPILGSTKTVIGPLETSGELTQRLSELGVGLLNELLPQIYSGMSSLSEQSGQSSMAPKLNRSDAKLDVSKSAQELELVVRAMNPEPIAWFNYDGEPFRILRAKAEITATGSLGELVGDSEPIVVCGQNTGLRLVEVQPAGKKIMSGTDWFRGLRSNGRFS